MHAHVPHSIKTIKMMTIKLIMMIKMMMMMMLMIVGNKFLSCCCHKNKDDFGLLIADHLSAISGN